MPNIGFTEMLVIVALAALLFGARRLPELGRNLGSGMREFKKSLTGENEERRSELTDRPKSSVSNANEQTAKTSGEDRSNPS